jgi:branched-chain amino acid transport system substrate-binding protein
VSCHWIASAATLALLAGYGCSLLISQDAAQCHDDADCLHFGAARCVQGGCMPADAAAPVECALNQDCASRGDFQVCRAADHRCISLLSQDCVNVHGDWANDNAIYIGLLLKLVSSQDGGADLGANPDLRNATELAFDELAQQVVGLPGGKNGKPRPLVLVECDHGKDPVRAASYLTRTVQVPAIIGGYTSGVVITVLSDVTVPDGVLFISPSATSAALSSLSTNHLFWRTVPSDALQGRVHALLLSELEPQVRAERSELSIKVAMVDKGDAYGTGLRDVTTATLTFNGKTAADNQADGDFFVRDYPNTDDPQNANYDFSAIVAAVIAFRPDVVLIFGTDEVVRLFTLLEAQWPADKPRPYLLFSDGALVQPFFDAVDALRRDGGPDDPRRRIRGTRAADPSGSAFTSFRIRLAAAFPGTDPFADTANAYDAAYVVAYGLAALGSAPITGASLATAFHRLLPPGTSFDVGPRDVGKVLTLLTGDGGLDLNGASGNLDFNTATGDVTDDIDVWCLSPDAMGGSCQTSSGEIFSASNGVLLGGFNRGNACGY